MDLKRKVKGIPLILIVVVALLTVGAVAQQVTGQWFFNKTDPLNPPADGSISYEIVITDLIEFVYLEATISGTGEVGTLHTVDYTITNIGVQTLTYGRYHMGFMPQFEGVDVPPAETVLSDIEILDLLPSMSVTGSIAWTPSLISDYRCFFGVYQLAWNAP